LTILTNCRQMSSHPLIQILLLLWVAQASGLSFRAVGQKPLEHRGYLLRIASDVRLPTKSSARPDLTGVTRV
jgi:hypothetical protein